MNIEEMIKLKEAGFTAQEIKELMNITPQEMKVEEKVLDKKEEKKEEKVLDKKEENKPEVNAFEEMMNSFKESMNQQMEAFKQQIQLSNMNANLGAEQDSSVTAEQVVANIINPYTKK